MARGGREKRCVLRSQQSARIRDRSDHHRCLYCDDVPAERPHRDGLFAGAPFLSAFLLFVLEPMMAKSILPTLGGAPMAWNTRLRGTEVRIEFARWLCPSIWSLLTNHLGEIRGKDNGA